MGYLQNEDHKTEAEILSGGGAKTQLLNDTKVYCTSVSQTLDDAVTMGLLGGALVAFESSRTVAPTGTLNSSQNVIKFATHQDTHSAYSNSTGLYTVPASQGGFFLINCFILITCSSSNAANATDLRIYLNGSELRRESTFAYATNFNTFNRLNIGIFLNAGDTIAMYSATQLTGPSYGSATLSALSIVRVK